MTTMIRSGRIRAPKRFSEPRKSWALASETPWNPPMGPPPIGPRRAGAVAVPLAHCTSSSATCDATISR